MTRLAQAVRAWGRGAWLAAALLLAPGMAASESEAQAPQNRGPIVRVEARADAFFARVDAYHAGLAASTDLGSYVRLDAIIAGGVARAGFGSGASGRAEVIGRFLLDPFRQSRWGVYGGGGLIARADEGAGTRGYLTLLVGAELPRAGSLTPAIEVGIGGGTRVGLVLRGTRRGRR